jgi:eukaryotic-like serine/threonine-protein kinase
MPIESAAELLDCLRRLQIVPAPALDELGGPLRARPAAEAAAELVRRRLLTTFQADEALAGRAVGLLLGPYVLQEQVGEGGMGRVFRAWNRGLGRTDAVKVLRPGKLNDPESVARFRREARAAAGLSHPNIVKVHGSDAVGDLHYLAMEFLHGTDLGALLDRRNEAFPVHEACDYARQAALGLQHLHESGLIHRDIKPSNLFVTEARGSQAAGVVKILDLGLARLAREAAGPDGLSATLTREGDMVGTLDYLAPEQAINAHVVDIRADIYSLGCTLYCLLAGQPPYATATVMQKLLCHQLGQPTQIGDVRPALPDGLGAVVHRMMAKRPADRYDTPAEVAEALVPFTVEETPATDVTQHLLPPAPDTAEDDEVAPTLLVRRRRWPAAAAAAAVVVVGLGLGLSLGPSIWPGLDTTTPSPSPSGDLPERLRNSIGLELVLVRPGTFQMGSPVGEEGRTPEEVEHAVTISRPYYLGVTEVTQRQYRDVMGDNPAAFDADHGGGPDHPVERVSWYMAINFCRDLSNRPEERAAGRSYRLPTEAEWEFACRAGSTGPFASGSRLAPDQANYRHGSEPGGTFPVGRFPANARGLFDMHGNVWEWCQDRYAPGYYRVSPAVDPPGAPEGDQRVRRGGSYENPPTVCRSAARGASHANQLYGHLGFRVALTVAP